MYDSFINEWGNNTRQVTKFGGECVALIAEFEAENNLPIVWGDAHVWANNPIMLGAYNWTTNDPTDPNQLPNRGDIIVWPLPNEHIAFFDHQMENHQFMSYGQNSGGKLAHFQPHSWANVAGWYSLKQAPPPPPPAPEPIPVAVPEPEPEPPKPYVAPPGAATVSLAQTFPLVTTVMYYNTKDDAKAKANPIGTISPAGNLTYYVFLTDGTAVQLGTSNQKAQYWINRLDNTAIPATPIVDAQVAAIEVKPEPPKTYLPSEVPIGLANDTSWKAGYRSFHEDRSPDVYEMLMDWNMKEYGGKRKTVPVTEGKKLNVCGTFPKNGVLFYRPRDYKNDVTFEWYYGIPKFDDHGNPTMRKIVDVPVKVTIADLFHVWREDVKKLHGYQRVMDVFKPKRS